MSNNLEVKENHKIEVNLRLQTWMDIQILSNAT